MKALHRYLIDTFVWINGSNRDHAIHFARSRIETTDPKIEKHVRIQSTPVDLLYYVRRVLPTEDFEKEFRSLSVMVRSKNCITGPHIDQPWVSEYNQPFVVLNLSDVSYIVQFSRDLPASAFSVTIPPWAGYRLEGQYRRDWKHAVGGSPRRALIRIGLQTPETAGGVSGKKRAKLSATASGGENSPVQY